MPFGNPEIRYRIPKLVVEEIGLLANNHGIKIVYELFVLSEKYYMAIVELLIERGTA